MRRFAIGINLKLPGCDPDRLYFGALLLVSADYPAAGQFCGTMESVWLVAKSHVWGWNFVWGWNRLGVKFCRQLAKVNIDST